MSTYYRRFVPAAGLYSTRRHLTFGLYTPLTVSHSFTTTMYSLLLLSLLGASSVQGALIRECAVSAMINLVA